MAGDGKAPSGATQRLRAAIDRGETGDKLSVEDPAAAPLGTDDEVAGQGPADAAVEAALHEETGRGLSGEHRGAPDHKGERSSGPILAGVTLLLLAIGGVGVWWLR